MLSGTVVQAEQQCPESGSNKEVGLSVGRIDCIAILIIPSEIFSEVSNSHREEECIHKIEYNLPGVLGEGRFVGGIRDWGRRIWWDYVDSEPEERNSSKPGSDINLR